MITAPTLADANAASDFANETVHVFCCNPDLALCGQDLTGVCEVPYGVGHDCVVCLDLENQPCPTCGIHPDHEGAPE